MQSLRLEHLLHHEKKTQPKKKKGTGHLRWSVPPHCYFKPYWKEKKKRRRKKLNRFMVQTLVYENKVYKLAKKKRKKRCSFLVIPGQGSGYNI